MKHAVDIKNNFKLNTKKIYCVLSVIKKKKLPNIPKCKEVIWELNFDDSNEPDDINKDPKRQIKVVKVCT